MKNNNLTDKFADMWKRSRADAGMSQDELAAALGVKKRTIQNWECGRSCPDQEMGFAWFKALGLQPLPYYLRILYDDLERFDRGNIPDEDITEMLIALIYDITPEERRHLLYLLAGHHGSSPAAVLSMLNAHLHTPLIDRINIAGSIITNYEIAEATDALVCPERVRPDMEILKAAFRAAVDSVKKGNSHYTVTGEEGEDISETLME